VTQIISDVKSYFGHNSLSKKLDRLYLNNSLSNYIGRPLKTKDRSLAVNHYLQSSAAEMAILMFSDFFKENLELNPLYVIHDAVIFDADKKFVNNHPDNSVINLQFKDWKFESKISYLS